MAVRMTPEKRLGQWLREPWRCACRIRIRDEAVSSNTTHSDHGAGMTVAQRAVALVHSKLSLQQLFIMGEHLFIISKLVILISVYSILRRPHQRSLLIILVF